MSSDDSLKFIIDEPATEDFFNTHSPVAAAIARAITQNRELKIIGLLGRWGSGKSTIVAEVEALLRSADEPYLTFKYDAWLHQNDPLRRSFIESLVAFLKAQPQLIDHAKWDKELKRLSGSLEEVDQYETPIITPEAKLFFFLAIFMAFGASLLGLDTFKEALSPASTPVGQWTFVVALMFIFAPPVAWLLRYCMELSAGRKANFFPNIIFNKTLDHKNVVTQKSVEPTSIEFGQSFRDLMKEIRLKNKRLAIVIDNIDRIDENEAMKIWANARSFFLSSHDDNEVHSEPYHPVVILPIDAKSISNIFSNKSNNDTDNGVETKNDHSKLLGLSLIRRLMLLLTFPRLSCPTGRDIFLTE